MVQNELEESIDLCSKLGRYLRIKIWKFESYWRQ